MEKKFKPFLTVVFSQFHTPAAFTRKDKYPVPTECQSVWNWCWQLTILILGIANRKFLTRFFMLTVYTQLVLSQSTRLQVTASHTLTST